MPTSRDAGSENIAARLVFEERATPLLLDVSSLFYDIELLHDLGVLVWDSEYRDFRFSRYFWYRNGRPLRSRDRLRVSRMELASPLSVELVFGSVAAVWVFVQLADKVANWRLNRRKLALEIDRLEAERNTRRHEEETARATLERALLEREASEILVSLVRRLESSSIQVKEMEVLRRRERE